ncbi:hypothetical protein L3V79_09545 [Thiotrichales bacterium 19S9-12]|nr:hypothetical protein [Thiotrichales bacterium 19S9-11]MCF6812600.1 hypothetical protein [Thiotrichales bacterium 19S9-12]
MTLIYQNNEIGHWYDLILMAQKDTAIHLEDELEGYVVTMLMRFNQRHNLADAVLAIEFLEALDKKGKRCHNQMREVADKCLIYSGLFPERSKKKRVNDNYFIQVGQSAYGFLCEALSSAMPILSQLYEKLSKEFITVVNVIDAMRIKSAISEDQAIEDAKWTQQLMHGNKKFI